MAVRQQLRGLLRDPEFIGSITVERSSVPASTARAVMPSLAASQAARAAVVSPPRRRRQGPKPGDCAVFHCRGCWAVLGDSLHLCAEEEKRLRVLVCFKVTNNVVCEDSLMLGLEGALVGCSYNTLTCQSCGLMVGFVLHCAPSGLAYLRGFFCFFKENIICYLLENQMIIEASKVDFPSVTLKGQVQELKEKLVKAYFRLDYVMKKLEEQNQ